MITITAEIYTPRWGNNDTYTFEFGEQSMSVSMIGPKAVCTYIPGRDPVWSGDSLEGILRNNLVHPPVSFQDLIEHLWNSWRDGDINEAELNKELQEVIVWLNKITKLKPKTEFWSQYF
ncbi:hypothetical protein ANA_P30010 (plasmid) [Anabaena sp. 90]|uniref:hypothetical protein n=1 Tax=Anabaena sp. 90 TaxID=46234 RepID=UPI00029B785A|nr:hypothetical protein [Anabaena sp. 90]AFW97315.1 hypothetical protein ANA_P30010 [Anabaena sp. 90]